MNNDRRKQLKAIAAKVAELNEVLSGIKFGANELAQDLQDVLDAEQEAFDAMPESLQDGERGQVAQAALQAMQDAFDLLEQVYDMEDLDTAIEALEQAQA